MEDLCHCFWLQRKALLFSKYLLSTVVHVPPIMLCPSEDKEVSEVRPVLKVVSSGVIQIFTSNVWAKQSSTEEPRIGCLWAECGIFLKPASRHINSLYALYIGEKTKSTHNLLK